MNTQSDTIKCPICGGWGDIQTDAGTHVCTTCDGASEIPVVITTPIPLTDAAKFTLRWRDGNYFVSIPNVDTCEVVKAEVAAGLETDLTAHREALNHSEMMFTEIESNLEAFQRRRELTQTEVNCLIAAKIAVARIQSILKTTQAEERK